MPITQLQFVQCLSFGAPCGSDDISRSGHQPYRTSDPAPAAPNYDGVWLPACAHHTLEAFTETVGLRWLLRARSLLAAFGSVGVRPRGESMPRRIRPRSNGGPLMNVGVRSYISCANLNSPPHAPVCESAPIGSYPAIQLTAIASDVRICFSSIRDPSHVGAVCTLSSHRTGELVLRDVCLTSCVPLQDHENLGATLNHLNATNRGSVPQPFRAGVACIARRVEAKRKPSRASEGLEKICTHETSYAKRSSCYEIMTLHLP